MRLTELRCAGRYTATLRRMAPVPTKLGHPDRFNILVFGLAGASKSSFINSAITLMSCSGEIYRGVQAGGGLRHNTTRLAKYQLADTNIALVDTWGLTKENYTGGELRAMLEGELPAGWDMGFSIDAFGRMLQDQLSSAYLRKIHAVLFFAPQAAMKDPALKPVRGLLKANFAFISSQGAVLERVAHHGVECLS